MQRNVTIETTKWCWLVVTAVWATLGMSCEEPGSLSNCRTIQDCGENHVCWYGQCTPTCQKDEDCGANLPYCRYGICASEKPQSGDEDNPVVGGDENSATGDDDTPAGDSDNPFSEPADGVYVWYRIHDCTAVDVDVYRLCRLQSSGSNWSMVDCSEVSAGQSFLGYDIGGSYDLLNGLTTPRYFPLSHIQLSAVQKTYSDGTSQNWTLLLSPHGNDGFLPVYELPNVCGKDGVHSLLRSNEDDALWLLCLAESDATNGHIQLLSIAPDGASWQIQHGPVDIDSYLRNQPPLIDSYGKQFLYLGNNRWMQATDRIWNGTAWLDDQPTDVFGSTFGWSVHCGTSAHLLTQSAQLRWSKQALNLVTFQASGGTQISEIYDVVGDAVCYQDQIYYLVENALVSYGGRGIHLLPIATDDGSTESPESIMDVFDGTACQYTRLLGLSVVSKTE